MQVSLKYAVTSRYYGLSGVNVTALVGIHQFETDRTIRKVSLRMASVWHQRCNSTRVSQLQGYVRFFRQPKHAFIYDSGAKLTALGIHRLKADPTEQEVSPRTVPVRHQRYNNKPSKTSIQSKVVPTSIHYEYGGAQVSIIHGHTLGVPWVDMST